MALTNQDQGLFDGWCIAQNIDWEMLPPARFCNLTYYWATENLDRDTKTKFDRWLYRQLPEQIADEEEDVDPNSPWSPEAQKASLLALQSQVQG